MGKPLYMGYGSCLLLRDYQTYDPLLGAISVSWSLLTLSRLWSCCSLTSQLWPHYCSPWTSLYHISAFLDHLYSANGEALSQKPYDNGWLVKLFERFPMLRTIHCLLVFRVLEWLPQKLTQKHFWLYFPHLPPWSTHLSKEVWLWNASSLERDYLLLAASCVMIKVESVK